MQLQDVFEQLTFGELKQQSLGGFKQGGIQPEDYPEVVSHVNQGLLTLYTKFPLRTKEFLVNTEGGLEIYRLVPENGNLENFDADLIRIDAVYSSQGILPIGDENEDTSVFIPEYNVLQVPNAISETLSVIYRARPEKMTGELTQDIPLPEVLIPALLTYVLARVNLSRGGEVGRGESMQDMQRFEMQCLEVEKRNILNNDTTGTDIRPKLRGWV